MISKTGKAYQLAVSVFIVSTTIGQVVAIEKNWIKALILLPNLIAWTIWCYCYVRYPHFNPSKRQITKVSDLLKATREIQSRHVRDESELHRVWLCDTIAYGEGNFDFQQTLSWWEKYPFSPYVLFEGSEILGSCGIWPFEMNTFRRLKEGVIPEEQVTSSSIISPEDASKCVHWYFAGILLRTERDIFHEYLADSLEDWAGRLGEHDLIHCVSLEYTKADGDLLRTLGFSQYKKPPSKNRMPVFCRTFRGREEVNMIINALRAVHDGRAGELVL